MSVADKYHWLGKDNRPKPFEEMLFCHGFYREQNKWCKITHVGGNFINYKAVSRKDSNWLKGRYAYPPLYPNSDWDLNILFPNEQDCPAIPWGHQRDWDIGDQFLFLWPRHGWDLATLNFWEEEDNLVGGRSDEIGDVDFGIEEFQENAIYVPYGTWDNIGIPIPQEICPKCDVQGRVHGLCCKCPVCGHVIWGI